MERMRLVRGSRDLYGAATVVGIVMGVAVLVSTAQAARRALMYKMEPRRHGAVDGVTQEQIRRLVVDLAERRGWAVHVRTAGVVEADISLSRGKHKATIVMVFDDENFAIRYVSSFNLGYSDTSCKVPAPDDDLPPYMEQPSARLRKRLDGGCVGVVIHPTYNDWVRSMESAIAESVPRLRRLPAGESPPAATALSLAEETRKLEALNASGVLTDSELEAHKRLLVASD